MANTLLPEADKWAQEKGFPDWPATPSNVKLEILAQNGRPGLIRLFSEKLAGVTLNNDQIADLERFAHIKAAERWLSLCQGPEDLPKAEVAFSHLEAAGIGNEQKGTK